MQVRTMSNQQVVRVELGERSYNVVIGSGVRSQIASMVPSTAKRAVIVTQATIPFSVEESLVAAGISTRTINIGLGEEFKSLATIEMILRECAQFGLTRNDVIIGVGGGMVTDIAGFAASAWHRGIAVVHVSTSITSSPATTCSVSISTRELRVACKSKPTLLDRTSAKAVVGCC